MLIKNICRGILIPLVFALISCQTTTFVPTPDKQLPQPKQPETMVLVKENLWLGILLEESGNKLLIKDLFWNSPAEHAGIKAGDQLTVINGKKTSTLAEAKTSLYSLPTNAPVRLNLIREEEKITLSAGDKKEELSTPDLPSKYREFWNGLKHGETVSLFVSKKLTPLEFSIKAKNIPPAYPLPVEETPAEPITPTAPSAWMGVQLSDVNDLEPFGEPKGQKGVRIDQVVPDTPAQKAGLQDKDIIINYDSQSFKTDETSPLATLSESIKSKKPGTTMNVTVLRENHILSTMLNGKPMNISIDKLMEKIEKLNIPSELQATLTKKHDKLIIPVILGARPEFASAKEPQDWDNETLHPELKNYKHPIEESISQIMEWTAITDKYADLLKRYTDDEKWEDAFRLKEIKYLHRDPFKMEKISADFLNQLQSTSNISVLPLLISYIGREMDMSEYPHKIPAEIPSLKTGISLEEHVKQIESVLETASKLRDEAFEGLTKSEMKFLSENIFGFTNRYIRDFHFSDPEEIKKRNDIDREILALAERVDYAKLLKSAQVVASLFDEAYLKGLSEDAGDKDIAKDTKWGKIIIGNRDNDQYLEFHAVIIDLGGNDFYADTGASSLERPSSIIIDYKGNDTYSSYNYACQGTGILGSAFVVDLAGNDAYVAQDWGQGSGFFGIGVLYDKEGNDIYRGKEYVQGAGFFGLGILIDNDGDDRYQANMFAQGFASTKGCGLLMDKNGNDDYYATASQPNSYPENIGTFNGFSQGSGTGIRCYADGGMSRSGGIGILIDANGRDRYEAGTFSQGGGYFFGWGLLYDGGENSDTYIGTRYAQGFTAHSALGFFMDEAGDDHYASYCGVHAGLSWDLTATVFIDKAGNDTYDYEGGFSVGAVAHNGFCLFYDAAGKDTYNSVLGKNGAGNSYHGGYSLSIFLDEDSKEDKYHQKGEISPVEVEKEYAITIRLNKKLSELSEEELQSGIKDLTK
ncbi:MAG: PDZ domain-containing protein [Planctomycetes bacterium]|nr:PDZ domain-containing protein [Planctomycetota bacterium]